MLFSNNYHNIVVLYSYVHSVDELIYKCLSVYRVLNRGKKKANFALEQAIKAQKGSKCIVLLFL
jgi:hypothetical protein